MMTHRSIGRAAGRRVLPGGHAGLRAGRPMGDVISDLTDFFTLSSGSVAALAAQVNRFGAQAPSGYQFVTTPIVATGNLDVGLATVALAIYQRRATDAYNQFHDQGSAQAIQVANQALGDPVSYVGAHMADVTQIIQAFGDSLGIPPAAGDATSGGPSTQTLLWLAGLGLAIWWMR